MLGETVNVCDISLLSVLTLRLDCKSGCKVL